MDSIGIGGRRFDVARRIAVGLSIAVVTVAISAVLSADPVDADSWGRGSIVDGVPEAVVIVTHDGTFASWNGTARGGARWTCGYYSFHGTDSTTVDPIPVVDWDAGPVAPEPGEVYLFACTDGAGDRVRSEFITFDPGDPFDGTIDIPRAIDEARARLPIPDPQPMVDPPDAQLVGLPMWMWLEGEWDRIWAEASIGGSWAGVAAWPTVSHWEFDDGSDIWCDRGTPYDMTRHAADQWSGCTHTFTSSSSFREGGLEWVRVTVVWEVEWVSSDLGGEPLGTVSRSVTFPVRVFEAQALVH